MILKGWPLDGNQSRLTPLTPRKALREAAKSVYTSEKYQKRGELGEILLHAIIRQEFETEPLISKIFFKDSANDTVKGFDAVHVVMNEGTMQLWLGEVKFYKSGTDAISDVIGELGVHLENNYLRQEFTAICHKVEKTDPLREHVDKLLHANRSLDEIFPELYIPVLLTYNSATLAKYQEFSKEYCEEIEAEFRKYYEKFQTLKLKADVKILLILLPMNTKELLVNEFDKKLKGLSL
ncbi:HamA C-terminal domain-containing protein [Methylophilus aquaticus]|uniref:DUF1837 domain-containing protein n=1 Tax=Methylophilus aquaticus TaxID=1971610 RepID=A0ABT9JTB1_9PROT|nr:DUF1837 domain-containing protein [Methylophilus aquaticus]MDP8567813.1 DUF1837 domain-containing protein [Methylophilus aquaticus]